MTSPIGHSLFALATWLSAFRSDMNRRFIFFIILGVAALAPDLDYFPILWGDFDLARSWHQGITHTILFTLLVSALLTQVAVWLGCGRWKVLFPLVLTAGLSHLLLDYLTFDGRAPYGIMLFWPLNDMRFSSPISVFSGMIKGSMGQIFSLHNIKVAARDALVLLPIVLITWFLVRKSIPPFRRNNGSSR